MAGNVGNPLIIDTLTELNVNPASRAQSQRRSGTDCLLLPARTGNAVQDAIYAGWLYAAVATPTGGYDGLFMTKDFGQNWTQVNIATVPPAANFNQAIPTNDVTQPNYAITLLNQGNLYLTLAVDPTNPNIVYLGSFGNTNNDVAGSYNAQASDTGLIRIDTTNIADAHNLNASSYNIKDGGAVTLTSVGTTTIDSFLLGTPVLVGSSRFSSVIRHRM